MAGELFFKIDIPRPPDDCAAVILFGLRPVSGSLGRRAVFLPTSSINFFSNNATINFGGSHNIMLVEWLSEMAVCLCFRGALASALAHRDSSECDIFPSVILKTISSCRKDGKPMSFRPGRPSCYRAPNRHIGLFLNYGPLDSPHADRLSPR
jgi:hypothetical protein